MSWQADPATGTIKIQDTTKGFDVELEYANFPVLHQLANQWNGRPTAPESLALKAKLDAAE